MATYPARGISNDAEVIQNISTSIGFLVLNFALLEFPLHGIAACIYHDMNGKNLVEPELPSAFSKLLAFLRKATNSVPEMAQHKKLLQQIMRDAKRISAIRNDVVHGYVSDYDASENHRLVFRSISAAEKPRTMHREKVRAITAQELLAVGAEAVGLGTLAGQLAYSLAQSAMAKKAANEPRGSVRRKRVVRRKIKKS